MVGFLVSEVEPESTLIIVVAMGFPCFLEVLASRAVVAVTKAADILHSDADVNLGIALAMLGFRARCWITGGTIGTVEISVGVW